MSSNAHNGGPHLKLVTEQQVHERQDHSAVTRPNRAKDVARSILMVRAQEGDRDAYRELLEDVIPYVRAIASRRLSNPADVEDAIQDVLLTIHAIRHTYDSTRPFAPWLAAIAERRVIDHVRRTSRSAARQTSLEKEHETFAAPQTNIDTALADSDSLAKAMDSLTPAQREAVSLLKLKELSLKEAAAASGLSVAALKVAMHRAMKRLRRLLTEEGS